MLYIEKSECPTEIADDIQAIKGTDEWKNTPEPLNQVSPEERSKATKELRSFFDRLKKDKIREALLIEQHYLCAYCMSSIENNPLHTTIEHWLPLSKSKETALDYRNFLATCKGGSDIDASVLKGTRLLCCDANKGDNDTLTLDPRNKEMLSGITYLSDGIMEYQDTPLFDCSAIQNDIDKVLRLNGKINSEHICKQDTSTQLVKHRKDVFQNTEQICIDCLKRGTLTVEWLNSKIQECLGRERREDFAGVAIFVYKTYLNRLQERRHLQEG